MNTEEQQGSELLQHALMQTMMKWKHIRWENCLHELSRTEMIALGTIVRDECTTGNAEGLYVSALAKRMNVTKSAVSKMLQPMEKRGLIVREIDVENRRNTFVRITPHGRELMRREHEKGMQLSAELVEQFGRERLRFLIDELNALFDQLDDRLRQMNNE